MLGYSSGQHTMNSHFGRVPNTFSMDNVDCVGSEASLLDCPHLTIDDCNYSEAAGVILTPRILEYAFPRSFVIRKSMPTDKCRLQYSRMNDFVDHHQIIIIIDIIAE